MREADRLLDVEARMGDFWDELIAIGWEVAGWLPAAAALAVLVGAIVVVAWA